MAKTKGKSRAAVKSVKAAAKKVKAKAVDVVEKVAPRIKTTILKAKETVDKKTGKTFVRAIKPAKATKPSQPAPPPPPAPPPAHRTELPAQRDIARLTRYGERFGAHKIDVRWLPLQLPVTSGSLGVMDPAVPKSFRVLDRPCGNGQFRSMLSIARTEEKDGAGKEKLAAITIHVGRPPIERWSVAHAKGQKPPKDATQIPRVTVTSGWLVLIDGATPPGAIAVPAASGLNPVEVPLTDGRKALALPCGNGEFACYWAVDAADKPICLVVDFDAFSQKDWKARPPQ